jgi:HK97 family phage portal protein
MSIFNRIKNAFLPTKSVSQEIQNQINQAVLSSSSYYSSAGMLEEYSRSLYVYACVSARAKKVKTINFKLNQVTSSKGDFEEVNEGELYDLLKKPSYKATKSSFIEAVQVNKDLSGEAFIWKVRDERNKVISLINLRPDAMTVKANVFGDILMFEYRYGTLKMNLLPEDVIHIKNYNPNMIASGFSPLQPAYMRIETEKKASEWQRSFFENNAEPSGVVSLPDTVSKEGVENFRDYWNMVHGGAKNQSKTAILNADIKYQAISATQKEMDFINSMKFTREDILVAYHVPKIMLSITDDINRSNAETALAIFMSETIVPEMDDIIEAFNTQLLPEFGDDLFLTYENPIPNDREMMLKEDQALTDIVLTRNEVRERRGLPPVDNGDVLYNKSLSVEIGRTLENQDTVNISKGTKAKFETFEKSKELSKTITDRLVTVKKKRNKVNNLIK